jgi:uncharacterized protein YciI
MKPLTTLALLSLAAGLGFVGCCHAPAADAEPRELRYVVFLRRNPARLPMHQSIREAIMKAHMANIQKMADEGVLVAAGPMDDKEETIEGIFVLKAPSQEEARRIAAQDPTVLGNRNTIDVHPWLAPAGIGAAYFRRVKEDPAAKVVMASHAFCLVLRGPAWTGASRPDAGHERFVGSLRAAGALAAGGPVEDDPDLLGIIIFRGSSTDEARKALDQDPAVRSGRISIEYHLWWTADGILPW